MRLDLMVAAGLTLAACGAGSAANGGGDDAGGAGDGGGGQPCAAASQHSGEATYYDADGSGNCSFDPSPDDLLVGAMNTTDYAGSAACGACVAIDGPTGQVTVRIVDRCPGCAEGDIDLSREAFAEVADLAAGRVAITWRYVACDVTGPLSYHFKDGSNAFWTAIQIRNHRSAIAELAARAPGGDFVAIERLNYNYFVASSGLGDGPLDLRVTDVNGGVVEDPAVPPGDDSEVAGAAQLPVCQ
jgi:expansin (peptidoglycan-binding protein)